jgi:hypothetical protein
MNYFKSMRIAPILPHFDKVVKGFLKINSSFFKSIVFPAIAEIAQYCGVGGWWGTPTAPECKNEVLN